VFQWTKPSHHRDERTAKPLHLERMSKNITAAANRKHQATSGTFVLDH
jgi:hypothetical protein